MNLGVSHSYTIKISKVTFFSITNVAIKDEMMVIGFRHSKMHSIGPIQHLFKWEGTIHNIKALFVKLLICRMYVSNTSLETFKCCWQISISLGIYPQYHLWVRNGTEPSTVHQWTLLSTHNNTAALPFSHWFLFPSSKRQTANRCLKICQFRELQGTFSKTTSNST